MADWREEYTETDGLNQRYGLLREEMTRLRGQRDDIEFFDPDAVGSDIRRLNGRVDGDLIVFAANDFGRPRAYRPDGLDTDHQNEIRRAILRNKYDGTNADLNEIRTDLLEKYPAIHKLVVAERTEEQVRYHLPEGSSDTTNFLTVREMVGLIDYTTNSFQSDGLSVTY